jgi:serine/threonine-protein kinase
VKLPSDTAGKEDEPSGTNAMNRQRVAELFDQAVDLPAGERAAWIASASAGDTDLHAELERLLHADAQAACFMEKPPATIAGAWGKSATAPTSTLPRQFGPYRVLRQIGVGGMGDVWLAERSDGEFEHRVAIKQLAYPTPGLLQRFRQERQILARLEHANIAHLIDGGVDAAGAPYLVMEYVEGVPITAYVRENALDLRARLDLFLCVCEGVQYAHQNLVVHRDLKPSNIFVTSDGVPKLLDFGIAKVLATTDEAAPTQTVARLLTPDYAAPEQFSGGAITTATDVYALGVVLYELLADARPPRSRIGAGAENGAPEPSPPSAVVGRTTGHARRRALRGDLDRIVLTALAHEPQRRYPSAEALAMDIRRYLSGRPISARGDSTWYRFHKFARRNRYALAAATIAFAVCLAATVISLYQARLAREQASLAREHAQRAESVRQFLVGVFEQVNPDENKGQPITAHQLLERGEQQLAAIDVNQPAIRADLTALISGLYWNVGDGSRSEQLAPQLKAAAEDPRIPPEIKARGLYQVARIEVERRMFEPAIEHAKRAIALAQQGNESGVKEVSTARRVLASALSGHSDPAAEPLLREILASDLVEYGERSQQVIFDLEMLGLTLDELSRGDEAATTLKREIELARSVHGARHSSVVNGLNGLAATLWHSGDLAGAEAAYREALDTETQLLGPDRAETLTIRSNLLGMMERRGQFADALRERTQMLEKKKNLSETRQDSIALITHLIGFDYRELGQFDKAEVAIREALSIWLKVQGSNDEIDSAPPLENLGVTLYLQGRYEEAEAALRHSAAIMLKRTSPSNHWLGRIRGELGDVLRRQRRYPAAVLELSEATAALGTASTSSNEANPVRTVLQAQLSEAQLDAGDAAKAESTATAALTMARKALPAGNYRLGIPLLALAHAEYALARANEAEALLREALAVRSPPHPANDPRVLEVQVALVNALAAQGKQQEASALSARIEPLLKASPSPYAADLRTRLATR